MTDLEARLGSMKDGQERWSRTRLTDRICAFGKLCDEFLNRKNEIIKQIQIEAFKVYCEAEVEVLETIDHIRYYCKEATVFEDVCENPVDVATFPDTKSFVLREPYGIVAAIKPWNFPFENPLWSLVPAMLVGNACILKPSQYTSGVATLIAECMRSAGISDDVFFVQSGGEDIGRALVEHPLVDFVTFTGSTRVGLEIERTCLRLRKGCATELSGNDVAIVRADADLSTAVRGIAWGAFCNTGQVCTGIKIVSAHEEIYDRFVEMLASFTTRLISGKDFTRLLVPSNYQYLEDLVQDAVDLGAKTLAGFVDSKRQALAPIILSGVSEGARILREEAFGPMVAIVKHRDDDGVISFVNSSDYALGASIWTRDIIRGNKIARILDVGMIWINDVNLPLAGAPWGGRRFSGCGVELCAETFIKFTKPKHICIHSSSSRQRSWWFPYE